MNLCYYYTIIALCVTFHTVSSGSIQRQNDRAKAIYPPLAINSKFLDPLLDDDTNLQMVEGEYGDEFNSTDSEPQETVNHVEEGTTTTSTTTTAGTESSLSSETTASAVPDSNSISEIFKNKKGQEKFFGFNILDWLKPMFGGGNGLGYGGLYGAQYYGLGNHYGLGLGRPSGWNFPFYNYPYFNYVKKVDTERKEGENKA